MPHGKEWKLVMRALGLDPEARCHNYSLEGVKTRRQKRWTWTGNGCDCKWTVTTRRHNELCRRVEWGGNTGYVCSKHRNHFLPPVGVDTSEAVDAWKHLNYGDNNGWLFVGDDAWEVRTNGKKYRVECKKIGHYACDSFTELDAALNKIKRSCGFKIKNAAQQEK